jgi:hypothetical protein
MSTCVRDKNNHNSLKHGSQILHLMNKVYPDVDAKTVGMYADLANTFPLAKGQDLIDALTNLYPIVKNLRVQMGIAADDQEDAESRKRRVVHLTGEKRQDALAALQKVHGVYDRLLMSNLIAEEQKQSFKKERARLHAFITKKKLHDRERNVEKKLQDLDRQGAASSEDFDQHSYLADEVGNQEEQAKPEESTEKRAWRDHASQDSRGSWRTRGAKPADQRKPWGSSS